jgi:trimethylamine--corrinoid protein Co-methyltransferase
MEPATTTRHRARRHDTEARRVSVHQLPWRQVVNPYPPIQPLSADQVESIHIASLKILKEIGMKVLLPEARKMRQAGADVDEASQVVKFESGLVSRR